MIDDIGVGPFGDWRAMNVAVGMLMERMTMTPEEALDLLIEASVSSSRPLADVARSYVENGLP